MNYIRKHRLEILLGLGLILLYFIFRSIYLLRLPIFTDEAIYTWWAQTGLNDASWRFISLVDGKQPLFVWFVMIFMRFIHDPLFAGRLVAVFSGFFTMIGLWFLSFELFKDKKVSFLTTLLYIVYPFAQVYDRMSLMDGMVGTFAVWGIYFSVLLVRRTKLSISYTLGFVLGGSMLTKSSGALVAYMLPFTLLLFDVKNKEKTKNFLKWVALALFAFLLAEFFYNSLRLSPYFYIIKLKNAQFVYPFSEWINHPFTYFLNNLRNMTDWLLPYFNVYLILFAVSFIYFKKFLKEKILLLLYFLFPFLAEALLAKQIFPRYIYSMTLSLLPLCALGFVYLSDRIISVLKLKNQIYKFSVFSILLVLFLSYPFSVSFNFATNPVKASIASADLDQYIRLWPSGGGVKESVTYLESQAKNGPIFIGTQGTFGLMPYALDIYLQSNPNIKIRGYYPVEDSPPDEILKEAKNVPTYFVFYQPCPQCKNIGDAPASWKAQEVLSFKKNNNTYLKVYRIE